MPEAVPVVVGAAIVGWAYLDGLRRLRRSGAPVGSRWQAPCFFAGLAAVLLVLATPFEHLAGERLWAHMVQHVTLIAVAAPLIVLGDPLGTLAGALPEGTRASVSSTARRLWQNCSRHYTALAALALGAHAATLWAWHIPDAYQAALRSQPLHVFEHATLFLAAIAFWWVVAGSRRRAWYGGGVLVAFAAALQGSALGALMTLAAEPWYPSHVAQAGSGTGLTPLEDQQVAGVIMWGPGGLIYALAAVLLFAAWVRQPDSGGSAPVQTGRPERARGSA